MAERKTVSSYVKGVLSYINTRPLLALLIGAVVVLDIVWLVISSNDFGYGVWSYIEYYPIQSLSIACVGLVIIIILIKKVDR